jgi:vaccinia related kinase
MKKASAAGKSKAASKPRKVVTNSHPLAKPLPEGLVLKDLMKGEWKVGKPIGSGGFGLLYLAQQNSTSPVSDNAQYVIKVEPISNGPLFCELHFYQRAAKPDAIRQWMTARNLKSLGVPKFVAAGMHEHNSERYRFMVMERFGTDLQKLFEQAGKRFPTDTVFILGLKLIDILEYIHENEYVHADIKASNLLVGYNDPQQVYLVDYGLAFRYTGDGGHKPYKEDPKRTHDGTVEFTSRDAHTGVVPSRRGDLEILGYCMLQWLCRQLPWEDDLENKNYVRDQKIRYMSNIPALMSECFPDSENIPITELSAYLRYVANLQYDEKPDYKHCRAIFSKALKSLGCKNTDRLDFGAIGNTTSSRVKGSPMAKAGQKRPLVAPKKSAKKLAAHEAELTSQGSDDDDDTFEPSPPKIAKKAVMTPKARKSPLATVAKSASAAKSPRPRGMPSAARLPTAIPATVASPSASKSRSPCVASTTATPLAGASKKRRVVKRRCPAANLTTSATQTTPGLTGH